MASFLKLNAALVAACGALAAAPVAAMDFSALAVAARQQENSTDACDMADLMRCGLKHSETVPPSELTCDVVHAQLADVAQCAANVGCDEEYVQMLETQPGLCETNLTLPADEEMFSLECALCDEIIDLVPTLTPDEEPDFEDWMQCDATGFLTCFERESNTELDPDMSQDEVCDMFLDVLKAPVSCAREHNCPVEAIYDNMAQPQCEMVAPEMPFCGFNCTDLLEDDSDMSTPAPTSVEGPEDGVSTAPTTEPENNAGDDDDGDAGDDDVDEAEDPNGASATTSGLAVVALALALASSQ